jgi:poly(hydroxyalkanoate) depolymerase family esterase
MRDLHDRVLEATRLTRSGHLAEATRVLRGLAPGRAAEGGVVIEGVAEAWVQPGGQAPGSATPLLTGAAAADAVRGRAAGRPAAAARPDAGTAPASGRAGSAGGARFLSCSFTLPPVAPDAGVAPQGATRLAAGRFGAGVAGLDPAGVGSARRGLPGFALPGLAGRGAAQGATRPYRLYVPASYDGRPAPLVVMLHGCTQSATDFALGTRMNEAAEARGCLVAWPEQVAAANASRCWRWFEASEQRRGEGEPALVVGIVRQVMAEYAVDPARVYVAGLSAGGAAAAVLGAAYPDLFAAIGVHSGLACGAARDAASAFAAMRGPGPGRSGHGRSGTGQSGAGRVLPAIVFHGNADATVHPGNADAVIAQAGAGHGEDGTTGAWTRRVEQGRVPGGRAFERVRHVAADGVTMLEQWTVLGAGHAWSGGSAAGSYTDPEGPDATGEMLRFFLEHPRRA